MGLSPPSSRNRDFLQVAVTPYCRPRNRRSWTPYSKESTKKGFRHFPADFPSLISQDFIPATYLEAIPSSQADDSFRAYALQTSHQQVIQIHNPPVPPSSHTPPLSERVKINCENTFWNSAAFYELRFETDTNRQTSARNSENRLQGYLVSDPQKLAAGSPGNALGIPQTCCAYPSNTLPVPLKTRRCL